MIAAKFTFSMASAASTATPRCDVGVRVSKSMPLEAMGLDKPVSYPTYTASHVFPGSYFLKMPRVLAGRLAAKMVGMATLRRPPAVCEEHGNTMCGLRAMPTLYPDVSIASAVPRRQPWPALIGTALINFRPIAFLQRLWMRPHDGYIIAGWYE